MHIVVINHHQQEFVEPMVRALQPIQPIFVFDRCEPVQSVLYKENKDGDGFLAGRMRDLGAEGIDDDILFLDGDKIPQGDILSDIESLKEKYDVICYGVDKEFEISEYRKDFHEDDKDGIVEWRRNLFPYSYGCYSCGIWISRKCINTLRSLNGGRIFHQTFDGHWGDEDNFLADEIGLSGYRIGYSTHVRLFGQFSDWTKHMDDLGRNFIERIHLRKALFGANVP